MSWRESDENGVLPLLPKEFTSIVGGGWVAGAFASLPPLCIVPQPLKTKEKRGPSAWGNVEEEWAVPGPGEPTGVGGGPAEQWERVMSRGLRRNVLDLSTSLFKEVKTLHRNLYRILECLASAAARVRCETRMRALTLGQRQECLKCWDGLQKKDLKEQQEIPDTREDAAEHVSCFFSIELTLLNWAALSWVSPSHTIGSSGWF